jgi:citrate synthase
MEGCAALLTEGVKAADQDEWCRTKLAQFRERKKPVPGFGHKMHKPVDPRTKPLLEVARANNLDGPYVQLLLKLSAMIDESAGKHITINATGALAALLLEIGIEPSIVRAIAVVSRCAGLVGHILEEKKTVSSRVIINKAREAIPYADPNE